MDLDMRVESISKATLVELGKKKTIKEEERQEEMGAKKENEAMLSLKGRGGSDEPRQKLRWFKKRSAHKAFFIFIFLTERRKTSYAQCVLT